MSKPSKFKGTYPPSWTKEFCHAFRAARGNKCERCGHPHDPQAGYALTIHHLDNDKSNCRWWNLAVLCQRCHLHIQGKVEMEHTWLFEVSEWFKPHAAGFFAWRILGQELSEAQVQARLDELLALGLPFYRALRMHRDQAAAEHRLPLEFRPDPYPEVTP